MPRCDEETSHDENEREEEEYETDISSLDEELHEIIVRIIGTEPHTTETFGNEGEGIHTVAIE